MKTRFLAVLLIVCCLFVGSYKNYACINAPPNVSITTPSEGSVFAEGDDVTIEAFAVDPDLDGYVTKVEFYQGTTKLGEDTDGPPWSHIWNDITAGSYSLTAKAFDNDGATTTSEAVGITVTDIWYVDAGAMNGDGQSWGWAFNSLQDALESANPGDEIRVAEGIYRPDEDKDHPNGTGDRGASFELKNGVSIYGGFAGYASMPPPPPPQPPPPDPDTRDIAKYKTVLSGDIDNDDLDNGMPDKENSYHVVTGADGAILDGFTITRGYADDDAGFGGGGLLNNNNGPSVVLNCTFEYNVAAGNQHGGAVYNGNGSNLQLINCLLIGNMGRGNSGGAIYHNGDTLWLNNCTIANNVGDGIHCNDATMQMYNCIVWRNRFKPGDSAYPVREICLFNTAQATIGYSNIEGGQAEVIQEGTPVLNWGAGNKSGSESEEPQFVEWGQWEWKKADGSKLQVGANPTEIEAKAEDITIFDLKREFADVEKGSNHHEDDFIQDMLDTDSGSPTYKKPIWQQSPRETSTVSNINNFNLWFNNDPDPNKGGYINTNENVPSWICVDEDKAVFRLDSEHFFPIDDWCSHAEYGCGGDPDCMKFCNSNQKFPCEYSTHCSGHPESFSCYYASCVDEHNYFFTLQYHTMCTYVPGQRLHFKSSDDLFVAINDHVIVNRAGYFVDCPSEVEVVLENGNATVYNYNYETCDSEPYIRTFTLGLEPHANYEFALFFAQRRRPLSVLIAERTPGGSEIVASFERGDYHLTNDGINPSPCIDAGDNSKVPYNVPTDLDSNPRRIDDPVTPDDDGNGTAPIVDMGAYEFQVPIAVDDEYLIAKNNVLNIAAPGVLNNDEYVWDDPIEAIWVSGPSHGSLTPALNADGSFIYTPDTDYAGIDSFTYKAESTEDGRVSFPATVTITVVEHVPVADAGPDQDLHACITDEYILVTLDGSGSTDEGGDIDSYEWTRTANGEPIATGETVDVLMSVSDSPHDVTLTVTDSIEDSDTDTVQIRIVVEAPEAVPGNYFEEADGGAGADVTLDGSNSTGVGLTYIWYAGGNEIARGSNPTVRFAVGTHTIGLLVIDECGSSDYAEGLVTVSWPSHGAEIDAGEPQEICLPFDGTEQLNGSDTLELDPDDIIKNYEWKVIGVPAGGYIVDWPYGTAILNPHVTLADGIVGKYTFQLIGRDDDPVEPHEIDSDTTSITVNSCGGYNIRPKVTAWILDGSEEVTEHTIASTTITVTLKGTITDDGQISGVLTGTWEQIDGPINGVQISPLTESCGDHCTNLEVTATATFNQEGIYQLALKGDDGILYDTDVVVVQCGNLLPEVYAGKNKSVTLVEEAGTYRATVPLHDAVATERTMPRNMTLSWDAAEDPPAGVTVTFADSSGEQNPTATFEGSDPAVVVGPYQLILRATDPDLPAPYNYDEDEVWISVYRHEDIQLSYKKSLYVISDTDYSTLQTYNIMGTEIELEGVPQNCTHGSAVGLALDRNSETLFVSFEGYGIIHIYDPTDMSKEGEVIAPSANNLAGIVYDHSKQKLYAIDRDHGYFYVYTWLPAEGHLILDGDNYIQLEDITKGYGIALDESRGLLYVCDGSYEKVRIYNSNTDKNPEAELWDKMGEIPDSGTLSLSPVGICIDTVDNIIYTGSYNSKFLSKYDLTSQVEDPRDISDNNLFPGATSLDSVLGLTVDEDTHYVYFTTGSTGGSGYSDRVVVVDGDLNYLSATGDIGNPADVLYSKMYPMGTLQKNRTDGGPTDVSPGDELTFDITYTVSFASGDPTVDTYETKLVDELPYSLTFISASHQAEYNPDKHEVKWYLGDLTEGATNNSDPFEITVKVNEFAMPGRQIINKCIMESRLRKVEATEVVDVDRWTFGNILYVNRNATGGGGNSWVTAYKNLQDAIEHAKYCVDNGHWPGGGQIWVAASSEPYSLDASPGASFDMIEGVNMYGGFKGTEASLDERSLNNSNNDTILHGRHVVNYVVMGENNATLDGFTITGGKWVGVNCNGTSPTISQCTITRNWDPDNNFYGWGIYCPGSCSPQILDSIIYNNGWVGIGNGEEDDDNSMVVHNCIIAYNGYNQLYAGYGIYQSGTSAGEIVNCIIYSNNSTYLSSNGYGICLVDTSSPFIRNNTIVDHSEYGIYNYGSGTPSVYNCLLWGNTVAQQSGCTTHYCYIDGSPNTKDNKDGNFNFGGANPFDSLNPNPYRLASNAECIDQGDPGYTPEADDTDIDGEARIIGGTVDIGADEFPPIWVDAGDTIFEKIPVGASSVDVDFTSAEIKSNGGVDVPTNLSYQWTCIDYPSGHEPVFISDSDTELYASATFSTEGWYMFQLKVKKDDGSTVGADLLHVRIDMGVEIVVADKDPVSGVSDERTYEAKIDERLTLSANFGPPSPLPDDVQWWAPYEQVSIDTPTGFNTDIIIDTPGLYPIELYAFNSKNEVIGQDRVLIEVSYPLIEVSAGPDRTLYLQKIEEDEWEVSDQFLGTVEGVTSFDRVEWSVEAADDNADLDSVSIVIDSLNPKVANITFGHYGAYYVVFRAWKNTSQGEVFLGAGAAITIVTYQQVELVASADDSDLSVTNAPATCNLLGELKEGQVDSVEWVFPFPGAPDGLVRFASPKSWNTMVSFNEVEVNGETFSGAGTYPIILLGKIRIGGEERVVASATVVIDVEVTSGTGGDFTRTICISPHYDEDEETNPPALPWLIDVWAEIEEGLCGSTTGTFEDYDYAVWSWSGSDNSVVINQPDLGVPMAKVLFNRAGSYILTLVVKNGGELLATTTMTIGVAEESCYITAKAGFNTNRTQKVLEDIAIGETIDLYGQAQVPADCINSQVKSYWSCGGSSDAIDLDPVQTTDPDVQATVTFSEPGEYPLTLRVVNAQTQELLASETILAVVPPLFWLDITGSQIATPDTEDFYLPLTATILGADPDNSTCTCTWSTNDSGVTLPDPAEVSSGEEVIFRFDAVGTYELTVKGEVEEFGWSQITDVTVWVSEDLREIETEWCAAGSTKYVTLPEPAHMSDALFVTTEAGIVPKWLLVSGPADVTFLPEDSSENPYVVFYEPGEYKLSLVPWDVQAGEQKSGTDASEVYVFVFAPGVHNPDVPVVTLDIEDGTSDNLKVLTAKATDKDGVSYLMLKLGDETLAEVSGDPGFYRELELEYELDISHLPVGPSSFRAYAWDTIGYMGQSDPKVCENNSAIRDFKVSPETIDDDTVDDLTFTASFDEARDWELKIYKADGSFVVESPLSPGVGDPSLEDSIPLADTVGWANGNYNAVLTVTNTGDTGTVHFRILRGQISSSDIIAELDSFVGVASGNISLINEWSFPDFALESDESITDFDSPIQVIKDGRGVVSAKLGNPDFPYDTEYRLQVGTVDFDTFRNRYYFNPIQVITPFDVPHDAMGWAPTPWKEVEDIGVEVIELGTVDLSMLENGNYYMQLSVRCDGYDYPKNDYAQFILDCPLKIGNVKFSQEDLVVETGGIPLRVVRTYDSFKKEKDSEFGYGWAYSIANLDIELDETRLWMYATDFSWDSIQYDSPISTRYGGELTNRNVTLTLPDGRRTTFMFYLDYHRPDWSNAEFEYYTAEYMSMPGIDAELRAVARGSNIAWWENGEPKEVCRVSLFDEEYPLYWEGVLGGSGEWGSVTQADSSMYDFCSYVLKMGDGTEYYFERDTLTGDYYDGGEADWLCFYGGDSILDAYYTVARGNPYLTRIKTADGEEINLNTDLKTGKIGLNGGDDVGIIECEDAQGNVIKSLQIVYYGDETQNEGRIKYIYAPSEVDTPTTPTLVYEYDDEGNLTKVKKLVNKNGAIPEEQYDVIEYVYEDQTHSPADHYVTDIKDPRGLTPIRYFYDAAGRLTETVDAKGNHITIEHDVAGKVEMVYERWDTDKIYPVFYEYNERGNVTWIKRLKILPEPQEPKVLEETEYVYETGSTYPDSPREVRKFLLDDLDNPIVTKYDYDEYGKPILTVDPEDNVTETFYYNDGNVKWVIQGKIFTGSVGDIGEPPHFSPPYEGDYTVISKTYNTYEGNKLKTTEVLDDTGARLQMTVNIYDDLNRLVNTVQIDVQNMTSDDFQELYNLQDIAVLPNSDKHSITSYCYVRDGTDGDPPYITPDYVPVSTQPYRVTDPAGMRQYSEYDKNGNLKLSYYAWDDPINSAGVEKYIYTVNSYDDQGRVFKTERIIDNDTNPFEDEDCFTTILSETKYDSLGKVDFTIDQYNNVTKYEYDQVGNLVETRTFSTTAYDIGLNNDGEFVKYIYDPGPPETTTEQLYASFTAFETDADTSHLTTSRTLYDREGRVLITVGPYDPAVYNEDPSEWPAGNETVYDVLGRVVETRRWAGVKVNLVPFKVIKEQSQPAPCQPDDPKMIGKMVPLDVYPANAWDGTGDQPANIGWTSNDGISIDDDLPVVKSAVAEGQIGPLSYTKTLYDSSGRVLHSVTLDEDGYENVTTYFYDKAGKQVELISPEGHYIEGHPNNNNLYIPGIALNNSVVSNATKINFDNFDYHVYESGVHDNGTFTGTHRTVTEYDGTRRSAVTDARGKTTLFEYDALGRLERTIHPLAKYYDDVDEYVTYSHLGYDGLGRKRYQSETTREAIRTDLGDADGLRWFYYDVAGRLTQVTLPKPTDADPDHPVYKYFYDDYGNQVGILDPLDRLTVFEYDELNRQTAKYMPFVPTNPLPADIDTAEKVYTALSNASPFPDVEYMDYDLYGRLEAHTDYKEQTTAYFYNNHGQLQYKRYYNSDGTIDGVNQNYDTDPENNWAEQTEYTYDTLGRRTTVEEKNNPNTYTRTTTYHYDAQGRIVQIDTPQGTINYGYNPITGRKHTTSTVNTENNYFYDELGRLETVNLVKRDGQPVSVSEQSDYTYNPVGSRESLTYANGNYTYHVYDAINRLTSLTNFEQFEADPQNPIGNTLSKFEYELYADGMRSKATENILPKGIPPGPDTLKTQTVTYTYDNLNRLTMEVGDDLDNADKGYTVEYGYNLVGNRLSRAVYFEHRADELLTEYQYDDKDQLLKEKHTNDVPWVSIQHNNGPYYAYAGENGIFYTKPNSKVKIGPFKAWLIGLPSSFSHWLFGLVTALLIVAFLLPAIMHILARIRKREPARMSLSLRNRCISVLLAYLMIVGPAGFEQIAHASTLFSELGTSSWGTHNRIIEYGEWDGTSGRTGNFTPGYDANGSVTKKITWNTHSTTTDPIDHTKIEEVTYEYNLQNRLKKVTTLPYDESGNPLTAQQSVVKYIYNTDGVLVQKTKDPDGSAVTTIYLVDSYNHTGYAQTLEEMTFNALDPDPVNDIPASRKTYTIGDDMLTEATAEYDYDTSEWTYYAAQLMYDGHGSTRQLVTGSVPNTTIVDDFSYDGYGVLLQDEGNFPPVGTQTSGKVAQQATNLLYAGEHFDTDSQNYYLRARWYDSLSGRFNRMDPFPGSPQDPQSLHKYIYCHANPINATDPSGNSFILNITVSTIIRGAIAALVFGTISTISAKIRGATWGQALWAGVKTAGITGFAFVSPLLAWSLLAIAPVIIGLGIYSGDITGEDVPEIVAYIAAGIALMLLFKSPRFKAWEVKTALKVKIPKAINNLKNLNSVKPARNSKWERAVNTNNKSAQGTLFHAELADLMRAEGMTNVGIEVSYDAAGNIVTYGTKGSIRLDYAIYHKGQIIKVIDLKPTEVINGNWLNKAGQYLNLSAEDFEALSYGGKL